jgi:hypothetical protein
MTDPTGPCETCGLFHDSRDGSTDDPVRSLRHDPHAHCAATIATIRAALDGLVAAADAIETWAHPDGDDAHRVHLTAWEDALRDALAAAKDVP